MTRLVENPAEEPSHARIILDHKDPHREASIAARRPCGVVSFSDGTENV